MVQVDALDDFLEITEKCCDVCLLRLPKLIEHRLDMIDEGYNFCFIWIASRDGRHQLNDFPDELLLVVIGDGKLSAIAAVKTLEDDSCKVDEVSLIALRVS